MREFNFINLNEFSWHLNIAFVGVAFAVFALIYDQYFIYYGFITFMFGVLAHIASKFIYWIFPEPEGVHNNFGWVAHIVNVFLAVLWLITILFVYGNL
jgi:hypothetical protein